ncbi:hypothetical protein D3C78_1097500 [compost metagenome]
MQQIEPVLLAQLGEAFDQLFLQTVELIAAFRQVARCELIFEPDVLKERRFIQRSRSISIIFQHLRIAHAIPRQIEAGIE